MIIIIRKFSEINNPRFYLIGLLIILCAVTPSKASEDEVEPQTIVDQLHQALIHSGQLPEKIAFAKRYALLQPVVQNSFDFPTIARIILGRFWKTLNADQQQQFINQFSYLSTAIYADQFKVVYNEKFIFVEQKHLKKNRILIKTRLQTQDENVTINYVLHLVTSNNNLSKLEHRHKNWRIINVISNGVSDLSLKRVDYTTTLEQAGFEQLIILLKEKKHRIFEQNKN